MAALVAGAGVSLSATAYMARRGQEGLRTVEVSNVTKSWTIPAIYKRYAAPQGRRPQANVRVAFDEAP